VKILRLTVAGFGPFKNEQVVDFEAFDDAGLFLITGKTGAGKSSILDAICYALYDSIPRYESSQQKLRSDYCEPGDPTFVELEFSVGSDRFRVRRTPSYEKPKLRGEGVTTAAATAQLFRLRDGAWEGTSARAREVGTEILEIVGLSKNQFLQVILLAQNRFQQFLRAGNDERQAVLRTLFGSQRFEQIEKTLDERRKALEGELAESDRVLAEHAERAARLLPVAAEAAGGADGETAGSGPGNGGLAEQASAEWFDEALAQVASLQAAAVEVAATADLAYSGAEIEHRAILDTITLQQRRSSAAEAIAALDAHDPVIEAARAELAAARRAAPVWPLATAAETASAALAEARETEAAAAASIAAASATAGRAPFDETMDLQERIDQLSSSLGALAEVLDDERGLAKLADRILTSTIDVSAADDALAAAAARGDALPGELDALGDRVTDASARAARAPQAAETLARLAAAREAAEEVARAETALETAALAEKAASSANLAAAVAVDTLLERRLNGHAAELAALLVDGEPCTVCGSQSHPAPAEGTGDPVTAHDIAAARDHLAVRGAAMDQAHSLVVAVTGELADARARALGRSLAELDAELSAARDTLRSAEAAAAEQRLLEKQREALRAEQDSVGERLTALRGERERAGTALTETTARRDAIVARVDAQRGDCDTVTERAARISAELAAVRGLADARAATANRLAADGLARDALGDQLREQSFDTAHDALSARRSAGDVAALEATIRRHDESRAAAAATLDEPGIALAPLDPIDVEPARLALATALARRDDTRDAARTLADRTKQLRTIVADAARDRRSTEATRARFDQLRRLAAVVRGDEPNTKRMRLETFVLAAQLEEIVAAANARLGTMTGGRYALEHDDAVQFRNAKSGLGLAIRDGFTGRARATNSLSGGETFLASLALALGLAEVVTNQAGGITLDTLFIDEGFGSLDGDTLEIAMSTLDGLRSGGRTIGLISHVEAMKEQIPSKLRITVTSRGYSEIEESHAPE